MQCSNSGAAPTSHGAAASASILAYVLETMLPCSAPTHDDMHSKSQRPLAVSTVARLYLFLDDHLLVHTTHSRSDAVQGHQLVASDVVHGCRIGLYIDNVLPYGKQQGMVVKGGLIDAFE
jgi:hypothetical protein